MYRWSNRSCQRLKGVHPVLISISTLYLYVLAEIDATVIEGVRLFDEQRKKVEQGLSETMNSKHLVQSDGFAHAVDLGVLIDGEIPWERTDFGKPDNPWKIQADGMKKAANMLNVNITCGIDWGWDGPHFQLD